MLAENARPILYEQLLAWQITIKHSIDLANSVKPVETIEPDKFQKTIIVQVKKDAIKKDRKY